MHDNIERSFLVHHKSSHHSPANMESTLKWLHEKIRQDNCHHTTPGLRVNAKVVNGLVAGIASYTHANVDEGDGVEKDSELEGLTAEDFDAL